MTARVEITEQTAPGAYGGVLTALTWDALDVSNGNYFASTGRELLLVRNDDTAAQTITITSVDDDLNRLESITDESIPAGEYRMFGPIAQKGWMHPDRTIWLTGADADLKVAVIRLPSSVFR
ncbi:hypothetical protein ES705_07270 [subsurface metagenome]